MKKALGMGINGMSKKLLMPILVILSVPIFLLLIKLTSLLLIMLFGTEHDSSIAFGTMLIITAIGIAVGVYFTIDDENTRFFK